MSRVIDGKAAALNNKSLIFTDDGFDKMARLSLSIAYIAVFMSLTLAVDVSVATSSRDCPNGCLLIYISSKKCMLSHLLDVLLIISVARS
jgi:hypothetical protein